MKIWLHFTKQLEPHRIEGNDQSVVDVTLSLSTQPKLMQIHKMEKTQQATEKIRKNIKAGWYKGTEFYKKQDELEDLMELYDRQKIIYNNILSEEKVFKSSEKAVDIKSKRIEIIEYIFVTFKNNMSRDIAKDVFLPEPKAHKCLRRICCLTNK